MLSSDALQRKLRRIDGRGYRAYRDLRGSYQLSGMVLSLDFIQADPFAPPSRLSVKVEKETSGIPADLISTPIRRIATGDLLTRAFHRAVGQLTRKPGGTGHSGSIRIEVGGQEVLERNSVVISRDFLEVRFRLGLPAAGRRVLAQEAETILLRVIPAIVEKSLFYRNLTPGDLRRHVEAVEDQEFLRSQLPKHGLVSFVANGSILPRRSGVDERPLLPLPGRKVVPIQSPPSLEIALDLPNAGTIRGMGIPEGVTLITGGGFHGKSTLLRALERGVYNHIPGDGRDRVVTIESACKIRSEDGRSIQGVDISSFINHLPFGKTTLEFITENASGSTSQAANIMEALELGSRALLIDEDTSATNFMIRDARMQSLVKAEEEPITPLVDRVGHLFRDLGVSTILVMGGAGDYLDVADRVIKMDAYQPQDVTREAREIVQLLPSQRREATADPFPAPRQRRLLPDSLCASRGRRGDRVSAKAVRLLQYGDEFVDLSGLEQLLDRGQTRAIGEIFRLVSHVHAPQGESILEALLQIEREMERDGLDCLSSRKVGDLARPRLFEVGAAINRLRTLRVRED